MMMVVSMFVLMRMAVAVPVIMSVFMSVAVLMTVSVSMLFTGFTAVIIIVIHITVMMIVVVMNDDGAGMVVMFMMMVIMGVVVVAVTFNLHVSFAATACAAHNPDSCSIYWLRRGIVVRLVTGAEHLITLCRAVNINKILHIKAGKPLPAFIYPLLIILVANLRSARFDFAQVRWIFPAQRVMCLRETQWTNTT